MKDGRSLGGCISTHYCLRELLCIGNLLVRVGIRWMSDESLIRCFDLSFEKAEVVDSSGRIIELLQKLIF